MTWKERRVVTFLSTILLILMVALLIVLGMRYRESRESPETIISASGDTDTISRDTYIALSYDNGSTMLSFSRSDTGIWQWDGNTEFPLADTVVVEILALLTDWAPQQTLTDAESLENSALDEPTASLSATTAGGDTISLLFGKTTLDGASRYVRLNGDESTVYIIADTLYQRMCVPIYDMCQLPHLPQLMEARMQTIYVTGPKQEDLPGVVTILTAQQAEETETVSWRSSGANVSDDPTVRALLEDLTNLSITKCIDYAPSEEAISICGFENPPARLVVVYVTEGGADQEFELFVGNPLPDGCGRYARIGEEAPIYLLSADLTDPLVALAQSGLEG